jgi:hypothetical protein
MLSVISTTGDGSTVSRRGSTVLTSVMQLVHSGMRYTKAVQLLKKKTSIKDL